MSTVDSTLIGAVRATLHTVVDGLPFKMMMANKEKATADAIAEEVSKMVDGAVITQNTLDEIPSRIRTFTTAAVRCAQRCADAGDKFADVDAEIDTRVAAALTDFAQATGTNVADFVFPGATPPAA